MRQKNLFVSLSFCFPTVTHSFPFASFPDSVSNRNQIPKMSLLPYFCLIFIPVQVSCHFQCCLFNFFFLLHPPSFSFHIRDASLINYNNYHSFCSLFFSLLFCHTSSCCTKLLEPIHGEPPLIYERRRN